jgi:hypothetical protein
MSNPPISGSNEQKPASPTQPQQTQGDPQQNQGGNKPSTDKPAQPQQK